tara:strand:- start:146 stop:655 length:510 start_codon:yes stop_codon:yes gene_type:complete
MSGYEKGTQSTLGGGIPGKVECAFGNTMTGSQVSLNRHRLRKAFKTNKVKKAGNVSSRCGPFRSAYQLGDPLSRQYARCGGCNQVNDVNSNVLKSKMADGILETDCNLTIFNVTPKQVPLASGNNKFVADSSLFTQFKQLKSINLTYNDITGGGDDHNTSYSFLNNLRS